MQQTKTLSKTNKKLELFLEARNQAQNKLKIADHLFTQTFHLLKEPKLLLVINRNLHETHMHLLNSLLEYEQLFKRAKNPAIQKEKIAEFKKHSKRLDLSMYAQLVENTRNVLELQKKSPIEFRKQESLILCDKEYNVTKITEENVKENIAQTKKMFEKIYDITRRHEHIFNKN